MRVAGAERALKVAADARAAAEEAPETGEDRDLADAARRAGGAAKAARTLNIIGIILLLLGAAAAGVVYLLRLDAPLYAAAGGAAAAGVLLLILAGVRRAKAGTLLRSFGVSSAGELDERLRAAEESRTAAEEARAHTREREASARALLESAKETLVEKKRALADILSRLGGGETDAVAGLAEAYIRDAEKLRTERQAAEEEKKHLTAETRAYDRETVAATLAPVGDLSVFEKVDITEYRRRRDFCENALAALESKKSDLEKALAALHATVEKPALLRAALDALDRQYAAAKAKYDAAELAIRAIGNASEGLRTRVSPRLADYAGKLLSAVTGGSIGELGVDSTLALTYMAEGGAHSVEYMSKGTKEVAYFALRLALVDLLYKEEKPPLVFDESFAYADDCRTERMLRLLCALAGEGVQSVVLSCHSREGDIAAKFGCTRLHLD